jgi:hypothetical protein
VRGAGWTLLAAGCMAGPNDLTLIDDVRLVAAVAEPPSSIAGETYTLTSVIVEPFDRPVDVVVWWCLPEDLGPCEVHTPALEGDEAVATLTAALPVPVWIVACVDGSCRDPSEADLRDPYTWLQELPLEGVAAASRLTRLTELPLAERAPNPSFVSTPPDLLDPVLPEAEVPLQWQAEGATFASGLTTAGGFGQVNVEVGADGSVEKSWFAPAEPGPAELYLVLRDEVGGSAVWRGAATVTSP